MSQNVVYNGSMKVAIFGGSFDPVHREHVRCACAASSALGLDQLFVMPSYVAPHKRGGSRASAEDRFRMAQLAFRGQPSVEVSDFELRSEGTSYSYLTCRAFAERFPDAERYFLVGADMLEDFFTWKNPEEILSCTKLAAFGRGEAETESLQSAFYRRFATNFLLLPFAGEDLSSTDLRVALAFGREPAGLDEAVSSYIQTRGLYRFPAVLQALELEKPERREHSYRVARMACARARSLGIEEEKALLAAAMHDCGKYVPQDSPLLLGFTPPENVPQPVLHQYTGAFLAEHVFGVTDGEILDAIRYHTSGREDMTPLGALIFLADLLEEGRTFPGVEELRALFRRDLRACLKESLSRQIEYLKDTGKPVYSLTERAYLWILEHEN